MKLLVSRPPEPRWRTAASERRRKDLRSRSTNYQLNPLVQIYVSWKRSYRPSCFYIEQILILNWNKTSMSRWCGYQRRGRLHWRYRRLIRRFSFCKCLRAAADRARPGPHLHTYISSVLYANGIYGPPVAFPDDFCVEFPGMTWPATLKGPSLQGLPCFCFFISILLHHIHFNIYSFFLYFDPFIPASLQCLLFSIHLH